MKRVINVADAMYFVESINEDFKNIGNINWVIFNSFLIDDFNNNFQDIDECICYWLKDIVCRLNNINILDTVIDKALSIICNKRFFIYFTDTLEYPKCMCRTADEFISHCDKLKRKGGYKSTDDQNSIYKVFEKIEYSDENRSTDETLKTLYDKYKAMADTIISKILYGKDNNHIVMCTSVDKYIELMMDGIYVNALVIPNTSYSKIFNSVCKTNNNRIISHTLKLIIENGILIFQMSLSSTLNTYITNIESCIGTLLLNEVTDGYIKMIRDFWISTSNKLNTSK